MNRRYFLKSAIASYGGLHQLVPSAQTQAVHCSNDILSKPPNKFQEYVSAAKSPTGLYSAQRLSLQGEPLSSFDLPMRGHSFAINGYGNLLAIGRRPGNYFLAIDLTQADHKPVVIKSLKNRRYYGHAVFNNSGEFVYLTENNLDTGEGVIGIYAAKKQFARVGEFYSYGVGPHDIHYDKKYHCLVVANGGIKTHPNSGRKRLNIGTMRSSLVFIDPTDGSLLNKVTLPEALRFNSIRHISIDAKSNVYVSMQNQRKDSLQTLLAIYQREKNDFLVCSIPETLEPQLNRYLGDITLDESEEFFATTSPRGNHVLIYSVQGEFLASHQIEDVCGIASTDKPREFMLTSGLGGLFLAQLDNHGKSNIKIRSIAGFNETLAWDNHLFGV